MSMAFDALSDVSDEALLVLYGNGDRAAARSLTLRFAPLAFRVALRMLGDRAEAEDLAQEVFVTVFKSIHGFRGDSKLSTWLYRVAANHAKNRLKYLQRRARGQKKELDELTDASAIDSATMSTSSRLARPDEQAQGNQLEKLVQIAMGELPDEQRELVVLRDIENLTYEEIQELTGLASGTVKSRLHRARLALATRVRELQGVGAEHEELP